MIDIIAAILLLGLLGERTAPGGAGRQSARQRAVWMRKSRLHNRWQLGEWPGSLLVLPQLTGLSVIFEIEFVKDMLDRRQD